MRAKKGNLRDRLRFSDILPPIKNRIRAELETSMGTMIKALLNMRTAMSGARTAFYGAIAFGFLFLNTETTPLVDATIVGAILADYVTWMTRTVALFPVDLIHGCYDSAINIIFSVAFFNIKSFDNNYDTEALFTGCFVFFLIVVIKVFAYSIEYARYSLGDD